MGDGMTRERWLSLGLQEDALPAFQAGGLQTIEAAGGRVVYIPRHGAGHHGKLFLDFPGRVRCNAM